MKPSKDHSVFNEPHLQAPQKHGDIDPIVDPPAGFNVPAPVFSNQSMDHVDYSVYDEPGVAGMIGKAEPHALTYANWLIANMAGWSQSKAWAVTLIVSMLAGPWAILALCISFFEFGNYQSTGYYRAFDFLMVCAFIPLAQEIAKIALPLWVVEKRPFYFTGWFQIFFCSLASATVFVTIYNLFGQFFFPPRTVFGLLFFWTAFLLMHLICATLSATGLEKIWHATMSTRRPPHMELGYPWFMAAFLVHVAYATGFFLFQIFGGEL